MRWAIIFNGEVENVVLWNGDTETWQPPSSRIVINLEGLDSVDIGWLFDGQEFHDPDSERHKPESKHSVLRKQKPEHK